MGKMPYVAYLMFYLFMTLAFASVLTLSNYSSNKYGLPEICETEGNTTPEQCITTGNIDAVGVLITGVTQWDNPFPSIPIISLVWWLLSILAIVCVFLIFYPFG